MLNETTLTSVINVEQLFTLGSQFSKTLTIFLVSVWAIKKISWFNHPFQYDPGSPPFVPYIIPFIGSGFSINSDIVNFATYWCNYFKSNIISVYCAGKCMIFVTDPVASALIVNGRIPELTWGENKVRILKNGLKIREEPARAITYKINDHHVFEKHLIQRDHLNDLILRLQQGLKRNIKKELNHDDSWHSSTILNFFGKNIFISNTEVVFGSSSLASEENYKLALDFDQSFYDFIRIDSLDKQKKYKMGFDARNKLIERIRGITNVGEKLSAMCTELQQGTDGALTNDDEAHYLFGLHWASYTNAVPSLFWLVYNLLIYKTAYNAVKEEILSIYKEKLEANKTEMKNESDIYFTLSDIDRMKNLDSILMETFRLSITQKSFRFRSASKDFKITLPINNKTMQFDVKKGTIFLMGVTTTHRDETIFKDALTFKWDRFLPSTDGNYPKFTKNGCRIHRPVNPFGGGPSICPGRRFAIVELKAFIATLLLNHDVRFKDDIIPPTPRHIITKTPQSSGFPASDVQIEIRKSSNDI